MDWLFSYCVKIKAFLGKHEQKDALKRMNGIIYEIKEEKRKNNKLGRSYSGRIGMKRRKVFRARFGEKIEKDIGKILREELDENSSGLESI